MRRLWPVLAAGLWGCGPTSTPLLLSVSGVPPQTQFLSVELAPVNGRMTTRPMVTFPRGDFALGIEVEPLLIGLDLPADAAGPFGVRVEAATRPPAQRTMMGDFLAEACLPFNLIAGQLKTIEISLVTDRTCPMP